MRETPSQAELYWKSSLDGDNRYMDGRRECEDIMDSTKFELYIYVYIYIYIYIYIYKYIYVYIIFLTYLYSYSITTLYHSVVSKNLFVFSMLDCS